MANYGNSLKSRKRTPVTEAVPGTTMVPNNGGGYGYAVDDFNRLQRFLILGSDGGTYYVSERELTVQNAQCITRCLNSDYRRTIDTIVSISDDGRAPKNSPAIFALAMAAAHTEGPDATACRKYALANLSKVCRIGTHLFEFTEYVTKMRGWGRSLRDGVASWYTDKESDKLAYQIIKYPQRTVTEGKPASAWSHKDILRLARPTGDAAHKAIYNYIHSGEFKSRAESLAVIAGTEKIKSATTVKEVCELITKYNLPHEVVPKQFANSQEVWETLLPNLPATALIRSLGRMQSYGLFAPFSESAKIAIEKISDVNWLKKSRLHPLNILIAQRTYEQGRGTKGSLTWTPNPKITAALEKAFYNAFDYVEPTGKNILLALDVSGSMGNQFGTSPIRSCEVAAVLAMVSLRSEENTYVVGFSREVVNLGITENDTLATAAAKCVMANFGCTNCGAAMEYATKHKLPVDAFVVITDGESNSGIHPSQALREFRNRMKRNSKLAMLSTCATHSTIVDPNDAGMIEFQGFDTAVPALLADFIRN